MSSFQWYPDAPALSHEDAVHIVLEGLDYRIDPRKIIWATYPANQDRAGLQERVEKGIARFLKDEGLEDWPRGQWFVGIPRFRVIKRDTPHLFVEIDLYLVVSLDAESYWARLVPKADHFDFPLALLDSLPKALMKEELEVEEAGVVEKGDGETVYDFRGREWRIPDAFLGFLRALAEKGKGFEGLLDPVSCALVGKFAKELPSAETPKSITGEDYQDIVTCLKERMGYPKAKAEEAAKYVMDKVPNESLENKIKYALNYLGR